MNTLLKNIPPQRLLIYFITLSLTPLCLLVFWWQQQLHQLDHIEQALTSLEEQIQTHHLKQHLNLLIQHHYKDADHFYIDHELESLELLKTENAQLLDLVHQALPLSNTLQNRYDFLTQKNHLNFIEGHVITTPFFQETIEMQTHKVEVDLQDLQTILAKIESPPNPTLNHKPPQMLITECKLEKKSPRKHHEVFELQLQFIKREFL